MNSCIQCGNQLKPGAKFCGKCGQVLSTGLEPFEDKTPLSAGCSNCRAALSPGVKFCSTCGTEVHSKVTDFVTPPVVLQSTVQQGPIPPGRSRPGPKKSRINLMLQIGASFILLAGIGVLAWYFFFSSREETDIVLPEYRSHPVVNGNTTTETKEAGFSVGMTNEVMLSDSSHVIIEGIGKNGLITLSKSSNELKPLYPGIETTGYMVTLSVQGNDSIKSQMPIITITRSQAGNINPVTVNMVRVGDLVASDGSIMRDQCRILPVKQDKSGNYVAMDYFFPQTVFAINNQVADASDVFTKIAGIFFPSAMAEPIRKNLARPIAGKVKYSLITFQKSLNWAKNPRLIQMTPDRQTSHFRHPATKIDRFNRTTPVVNVVVLVHGHNEDERDGFVPSATLDLWEFDYKRDVWNYMYQEYMNQLDISAKEQSGKSSNCTLFYEYIYPSYRPAYSTVSIGPGATLRTLGEDLGELLTREFVYDNPQISRMIKNNVPFNVYIVGHSMGGLVARAGIRSMDSRIVNNFRQLITWGSPHQGSPMTTLRYISAAGFVLMLNGYPIIPYYDKQEDVMNMAALDTPGTRDLRWTNGSKGAEKYFRYDDYFVKISPIQMMSADYDLRTSPVFYNDNLQKFNETERFASKYTFLTGSTSKIAQVDDAYFSATKIYRMYKASFCAVGSYFIKLLAADSILKNNDGASPVYGQGGFDMKPLPKAVDMGDMDHEEFYGGRGLETAVQTYQIMRENATCDCPYIDGFTYENKMIVAELKWPSDPRPGKNIAQIEATLSEIKSKNVVSTSSDFSFKDPKGKFKGRFSLKEPQSGKALNLKLRVKTKDGSFVESGDIDFGTAGEIKYGRYGGECTVTINKPAILRLGMEPGYDDNSNARNFLHKTDNEFRIQSWENTGGTNPRRFLLDIIPVKGQEAKYDTKNLRYVIESVSNSSLSPRIDGSNGKVTTTYTANGFNVSIVSKGKSIVYTGKFNNNILKGSYTLTEEGKVTENGTFNLVLDGTR